MDFNNILEEVSSLNTKKEYFGLDEGDKTHIKRGYSVKTKNGEAASKSQVLKYNKKKGKDAGREAFEVFLKNLKRRYGVHDKKRMFLKTMTRKFLVLRRITKITNVNLFEAKRTASGQHNYTANLMFLYLVKKFIKENFDVALVKKIYDEVSSSRGQLRKEVERGEDKNNSNSSRPGGKETEKRFKKLFGNLVIMKEKKASITLINKDNETKTINKFIKDIYREGIEITKGIEKLKAINPDIFKYDAIKKKGRTTISTGPFAFEEEQYIEIKKKVGKVIRKTIKIGLFLDLGKIGSEKSMTGFMKGIDANNKENVLGFKKGVLDNITEKLNKTNFRYKIDKNRRWWLCLMNEKTKAISDVNFIKIDSEIKMNFENIQYGEFGSRIVGSLEKTNESLNESAKAKGVYATADLVIEIYQTPVAASRNKQSLAASVIYNSQNLIVERTYDKIK